MRTYTYSPQELLLKPVVYEAGYPNTPQYIPCDVSTREVWKEGEQITEDMFEIWDAKDVRLMSDLLGLDHKKMPLHGKIAIPKQMIPAKVDSNPLAFHNAAFPIMKQSSEPVEGDFNDLIETVKVAKSYNDWGVVREWMNRYKPLASSQPGDDWVRVEDRLPEIFDNVLIYLEHDAILQAVFGANEWLIYYSDGAKGLQPTHKITNWMLNPARPKQNH